MIRLTIPQRRPDLAHHPTCLRGTAPSKADLEAFLAGRLGKALADAGVPEPVQIIDSDLENFRTPGR